MLGYFHSTNRDVGTFSNYNYYGLWFKESYSNSSTTFPKWSMFYNDDGSWNNVYTDLGSIWGTTGDTSVWTSDPDKLSPVKIPSQQNKAMAVHGNYQSNMADIQLYSDSQRNTRMYFQQGITEIWKLRKFGSFGTPVKEQVSTNPAEMTEDWNIIKAFSDQTGDTTPNRYGYINASLAPVVNTPRSGFGLVIKTDTSIKNVGGFRGYWTEDEIQGFLYNNNADNMILSRNPDPYLFGIFQTGFASENPYIWKEVHLYGLRMSDNEFVNANATDLQDENNWDYIRWIKPYTPYPRYRDEPVSLGTPAPKAPPNRTNTRGGEDGNIDS